MKSKVLRKQASGGRFEHFSGKLSKTLSLPSYGQAKNLIRLRPTLLRMTCRLVWLTAIWVADGCHPAEAEFSGGKLLVVTTTGLIADAVRNVTGDAAEVHALMGPGVDPHLYKATVRDIKLLTRADVVFYGGLHLEGKLEDVLRKTGRIRATVAVTDGIPKGRLLRAGKASDSHDPHIWFDVGLWKDCVGQISRTLHRADSAHAALYQRNTARYIAELDSLDAFVKMRLGQIPKPQRVLVTAHDAFKYFGRAYDVEVRGLQGISTLSEYGLRDVTDLVRFITERRIRALFVETSVSPRAITAVVEGCRARGHSVRIGGDLYSDALGNARTNADTYVKMVRHNVNTIAGALSPSAPEGRKKTEAF
mgnify:CR=1 FL=1